MKLKPLANNANVVSFKNGTEILFSYETPVAAFIPGTGYVRSETKYGPTTGKHIKMYCGGVDKTLPQESLDMLIGSL